MSWSYNASASPLDRVRRLLGDTDTTQQQIQDEELAIYLADYPNSLQRAAAGACDYLQALYTRQVDKTLGQMSISASQRAAGYAELGKQLRAQAASERGLVPFEVGGITGSQQRSLDQQPNLVQSPFRRNMYNLPGTSDDHDGTGYGSGYSSGSGGQGS